MTNHRSNAGRGVDPEQLIANLDDVKLFEESSLVGIESWDAATAERVSRRLGEVAGRAFGEAMGRELGAALAPLFADSNDLQASPPEWAGVNQSDTPERYSTGESWAESARDDVQESNDETSESDAGDDAASGNADDETNMVTDTTGGDCSIDLDDGRDDWGRRKAGLDWPLPPESRLPMESDSAQP